MEDHLRFQSCTVCNALSLHGLLNRTTSTVLHGQITTPVQCLLPGITRNQCWIIAVAAMPFRRNKLQKKMARPSTVADILCGDDEQ